VNTVADAAPERSTDFPPRRRRGIPRSEVVTFVAACPACGHDCEWHEERLDTRLRATVGCACDA
jgi:hypothetical protein